MTKEAVISQVMDERHDSFMITDSVDFFDGYGTTVLKAMDEYAAQVVFELSKQRIDLSCQPPMDIENCRILISEL